MPEDERNEADDEKEEEEEEEEAADEGRPGPEARAVPGSTGGVERGVEVQMEVEAETEVLELEQLEELLKCQRPSTFPTKNHKRKSFDELKPMRVLLRRSA